MLTWEQRKAKDIFEQYTDKGYPNLPVLSATQDAGMVERDSLGKNIIYEKANKRTYKRVLPGQFVIHLRSFQGGFAYSSIEGITSPAYTVLQLLNRKKDTPYFWQIIFNSNRFIDDLKTVTYGIRDGKSISFNDFKTLKFKTPFLLEQQKISTFLTALNKLITLHQRKLENLKLIKLGLIQNLFPINGKLKPTINMTNNVEDWQQLKLFDVLEIPIKERLENPSIDKLITVGLNLSGIRSGSSRETLEIGATTYYVRRKGQLIYGKQNFFNGSMAIIDDKYDGYATSGDVPALNINNNKVDSKFLYYYISQPYYYKKTEAQAIGTGSKRIHEKTLLSFEIHLPSLTIQKKIASLIDAIEKRIVVQNELLNYYINVKNKYLQVLFI